MSAKPTNSVDESILVRTVPLGGGALSLLLQHADVGHAWLPQRPHDVSSWRAHAEAVHGSLRDVDWLTALAPAIVATGRAAARLGRAASGGVVVTTGQQPGLFGGPTYTWSKALGALAMADELEAAIGMPVAPIFWAASDDADWLEAAVTHVATSRGLVTLSLPGPATDGVAMSDVPLGDVSDALSRLRTTCGSMAHGTFFEQIESAYVPQATIGAAYVQLLRALLEPLGIAVLDAAHAALRESADAFLRGALVHAQPVADALAERTKAIRAAGFEPQVEPIDDLSLVFRTRLGASGRARDRVRERIPVHEAARVAREADTGSLGANVLLRPVLERALLPTVTYLAGPGELAYFAQVTAVAKALQAAIPVVTPRWAGEIIDTAALTELENLGLDEMLLRDPHAVETTLAERATDERVRDAIERLRVTAETQVRAVGDAVAQAEGVVAAEVVDGLQRDLVIKLDRFERRVHAGVKRREVELMRRAASLRASLRPLGSSPERVLNLMPMLVRHGTTVFDRMSAEAMLYARAVVRGAADAP